MQSTYFVTHSYLRNTNFINYVLLYTTPIIQQLSNDRSEQMCLFPTFLASQSIAAILYNEIVTAMTQNTCSSYQYAAAIAD